jgi:phospholipid/cholesterol/gamma-HCH transport system substrate-binding protein
VDLASDTPVNRNTLARLTPQGVTGLLFIDLAQAPPNQRGVSPDVPSQRYPVIRSMPSNLDLFLNGLPDLVASANDVITRIAGLLNDENVAAMNATLANVRAASDTLPGTSRDVARLVAELRGTVTEAQAAKRLREASDNLASITGRVDKLLKTREPELDRFTSTGLGDFEQLVRESRDAVAEVRELARTLRENPSGLLYEKAPTGVEIQR